MVCFGGADLTVFSCGKYKHTVGQSVLVVQTHTNRLSHFHFSLLLTFCTCFFSLPANFLPCFFSLPANFLHLAFFFFIYFLEPTIYFLEPTIYCLFTSLTYMFNTFATNNLVVETTFSFVRLNVPFSGKS